MSNKGLGTIRKTTILEDPKRVHRKEGNVNIGAWRFLAWIDTHILSKRKKPKQTCSGAWFRFFNGYVMLYGWMGLSLAQRLFGRSVGRSDRWWGGGRVMVVGGRYDMSKCCITGGALDLFSCVSRVCVCVSLYFFLIAMRKDRVWTLFLTDKLYTHFFERGVDACFGIVR